jgi:hypothetical protein
MKVSKAIEELTELHRQLGDVELTVEIKGFGGHASYEVDSLKEETLCRWDLEEYFENGDDGNDHEDPIYKEFFPNNEEEVSVVELKTGRMLYAT